MRYRHRWRSRIGHRDGEGSSPLVSSLVGRIGCDDRGADRKLRARGLREGHGIGPVHGIGRGCGEVHNGAGRARRRRRDRLRHRHRWRSRIGHRDGVDLEHVGAMVLIVGDQIVGIAGKNHAVARIRECHVLTALIARHAARFRNQSDLSGNKILDERLLAALRWSAEIRGVAGERDEFAIAGDLRGVTVPGGNDAAGGCRDQAEFAGLQVLHENLTAPGQGLSGLQVVRRQAGIGAIEEDITAVGGNAGIQGAIGRGRSIRQGRHQRDGSGVGSAQRLRVDLIGAGGRARHQVSVAADECDNRTVFGYPGVAAIARIVTRYQPDIGDGAVGDIGQENLLFGLRVVSSAERWRDAGKRQLGAVARKTGV